MAPSRPHSIRTSFFGSRKSIPTSPPSPTFSDATNVSAMNFGNDGPAKIITRAHLKSSLQAYEELLQTSANYRAALMTLSKATAAFADALTSCSGLKGPSYEAGTRIQAASGLHHLIGNHWHVLADTLDNQFEKQLRLHLDDYKRTVAERSSTYERALRDKSRLIRETETRSMNRKERNLQSFREALNILQRQVDDLDELKSNHYHEIVEHEEEVWDGVQTKVCLVVRSTMDMFDRFTSKASDPIIESMLQIVPDPFDSYGPPPAEDQIFSILPPLSILSSAPSSTASPISRHAELDPFDNLPHSSGSQSSWTTSPDMVAFPVTSESYPSSPSSSSPPPVGTMRRSLSTPSTSTPIPKRLDSSKLRSIMTAIDETQIPHTDDKMSQSTPELNGGTIRASRSEREKGSVVTDFSWTTSFPMSYGNPTDDAVTPRNATFYPIPDPRYSSAPPSRPDSPGRESDCQTITIPVAG